MAEYQSLGGGLLLHCFGLIEAYLVLGSWLVSLWHVYGALGEVV